MNEVRLPMPVMYADGTIERKFKHKPVVGIVLHNVATEFGPQEGRYCVFDLEDAEEGIASKKQRKVVPQLMDWQALDVNAFNETVRTLNMFGRHAKSLSERPYAAERRGKKVYVDLTKKRQVDEVGVAPAVRMCHYLY